MIGIFFLQENSYIKRCHTLYSPICMDADNLVNPYVRNVNMQGGKRMSGEFDIIEVTERTVLDSRGNPAIEAEVILDNDAHGRAMVPVSGKQTAEAEEILIREFLSEAILFENAADQAEIDGRLLKEYESREGKGKKSPGVLALSMAAARAAGAGFGLPLYRYLGGTTAPVMPVPMMSMICKGDREKGIDFQELMIIPHNAGSYGERLRMGAEIFQALKELLSHNGFHISTGYGGGFAADVKHTEEALHSIQDAIELAGYTPGVDAGIGIWAGADLLYQKEDGMYCFEKESKNSGLLIRRDQKDMMDYYLRLADGFPVASIVNGLWKGDAEGRKQLMGMLGHRILMAFSNADEANADVIEMKEAGTVTAVLNMVRDARQAGHKVIIASDFIDTEEPFSADLAAAVRADYVKCGPPCNGECTAKYNELLRIEEFYYKRKQSMG